MTVACARDMLWPLCHIVLAAYAYLIRHWVHLHLAVGVTALAPLLCLWLIPESYRWLAQNGKKERALRVFQDIG